MSPATEGDRFWKFPDEQAGECPHARGPTFQQRFVRISTLARPLMLEVPPMAKCSTCGKIMFGGLRTGSQRFCSGRCQKSGRVLSAAAVVPDDVVESLARHIHSSPCPKCGGPGPIDIYRYHRVWSAVLLTRWSSVSQASCRRCGLKSQAGSLAFSALVGWWGFPWGLIVTPVQIIRNIGAMARPPNSAAPSDALRRLARLQLASHVQNG